MSSRLPIGVAVICLLLIPPTQAVAGASGGYGIVFLGELSEAGATTAHSISQDGQVVGESGGVDGVGVSAFAWKMGGTIRALGGLPGGDYSQAFGINNEGLIVGSSNTNSTLRAVIWSANGRTREIGTLPGDSGSQALGINARGEVVGYSSGPNGIHAFLWTEKDGMRDLEGKTGYGETTAIAINDLSQVVGKSRVAGATHAFLWTSSQGMLDLGTLPGDRSSSASGINNLGEVVGFSHGSRGTRAFFWTKKEGMRDLGGLAGGSYSEALGINDAGQVVGLAGDCGFVWTRTLGLQDLNAMLPADSGVHITGAFAINDRGQIAAYGAQDHIHAHHFNAPRAYLLTPSAAVERQQSFHDTTMPTAAVGSTKTKPDQANGTGSTIESPRI